MSKPADSVLTAYSFISTITIEKILSFGHRFKDGKPIPSFDEQLLIELSQEAQQIFMKERITLEIEGNLIVVGNLHGNLFDLLRILRYAQICRFKILFLGDFVDYGEFSIECLTLLFAKKIQNPDSIFLIRGDHEFNSICSENGFKNEIVNFSNLEKNNNNNNDNDEKSFVSLKNSSCYEYSEKLYAAFLKVFSYLPVAAIVNKTTFCVHGGLSPKIHHVDGINKLIKRPIYYFEDNLLLADLVSGEPVDRSSGMFTRNPSGRGYLFNQEAASVFLNDNSFVRMIRSHSKIQNGSLRSFYDRCVTVYSASSYDKFENINSAIIELFQRNDSFRISTFFPIRKFSRKEAVFYKVPYVKKIEPKKIPLSISLLQPQSFASSQGKSSTSRESDQINSQRQKVCSSSRLMFENPLKNRFMANKRNLAKKVMINESFSTGFLEDDE